MFRERTMKHLLLLLVVGVTLFQHAAAESWASSLTCINGNCTYVTSSNVQGNEAGSAAIASVNGQGASTYNSAATGSSSSKEIDFRSVRTGNANFPEYNPLLNRSSAPGREDAPTYNSANMGFSSNRETDFHASRNGDTSFPEYTGNTRNYFRNSFLLYRRPVFFPALYGVRAYAGVGYPFSTYASTFIDRKK